ncbi:MAG: GNAT family N-acetyltransferase [Bacteroidales bacterium]|nr:GNAT family N-acetyltransferase [Bacteroidales bacterium]
MVIRRLNETEIINSFICGDSDLDDFVKNEASSYQKALLSVNYIMERKEETVAFFSLSNDKISVNEFDDKTSFNRFRSRKFVNRKRIKSYPAVKIGRFAINLPSQGKGIGTTLLDFIKAYFLIDNKSGCRFITVDAYKSAIPFYEKNGFVPLQDNDGNITQLMYFDLADYRKSFF